MNQNFKKAILLTGAPCVGKTKLAIQIANGMGLSMKIDGKSKPDLPNLSIDENTKALIVDDIPSLNSIEPYFNLITGEYVTHKGKAVKPLVIFTMTTEPNQVISLDRSTESRVNVFNLSEVENGKESHFNPFMSLSDVTNEIQGDRQKGAALIKLAIEMADKYKAKNKFYTALADNNQKLSAGVFKLIPMVLNHLKIYKGSNILIDNSLIIMIDSDGHYDYVDVGQNLSTTEPTTLIQ